MDPAILKPVDLFQDLNAEQLLALAEIGVELPYDMNARIFQEGEAGDCIFVIAWGSVRISKRVPGVGEEALAVLEAGTAFGELMLLEEVPRSADAIAHTACILGVFRRDALEALLKARPDIALVVMKNLGRTLAHRLRETNEKIKAFFAFSSRW